MAPDVQDSSLGSSQNQRQTESLLLALPSELIQLICAQFCSHCCGFAPMHIITGPDDASPLKALSETCTALRDIAQPLLYHVPDLIHYSCFLRTIRERPDLADSVKCLRLRSVRLISVRQSFNEHTLALVKEMAAELQMITAEDVGFADEFSDMLALVAAGYSKGEQEGDDYLAYRQMEYFYALLDAILIASLPCLEVLANCGWEDYEYYPPDALHHAKRRMARAGRLVSDRCAGTTMPSLHTIIMDGWGANDRWSETHDDVHLEPHEFLFSCASSLTQLVFDGCSAPCSWPEASLATNSSIWSTSPHLKSIVFEEMDWGSCDPWGYPEEVMMHLERWMTDEHVDTAYLRIRQLAKQCKSLRSFKISINSKDMARAFSLFSPSRLVQSLLPTAERLETLMIHIESVLPRADPAVLIGVEMHSFKKLQELSLDEMCFCHHWYYGSNEENTDAGNDKEHHASCVSHSCLVDILPSSISCLNIRLRKKPRVIPDLVHLGIAAAAGKFPSLKHVTVEAYVTVREDSLDSMFYGYDGSFYSPEDPDKSPRIQALRPKLADAFRRSSVVVEVMGMRIRRQRGTPFRPALS